MGSVKYIDYNSHPILYLNFEGAASELDVIELGDKAKMLVKLGSRNKIFMLYNMAGIQFTRKVMANLNRLMEHTDLVERRVLFGADPRFDELILKLVQLLRLERNTLVTEHYTEAVNLITDPEQWKAERRHFNVPVVEEKRVPIRVYTEEDFTNMKIGEGRLSQLPGFKPY